VTSSQLNQVNTPIGNNKINLVPPSFEVSRVDIALEKQKHPKISKKVVHKVPKFTKRVRDRNARY
jgi:hypothetical protein